MAMNISVSGSTVRSDLTPEAETEEEWMKRPRTLVAGCSMRMEISKSMNSASIALRFSAELSPPVSIRRQL